MSDLLITKTRVKCGRLKRGFRFLHITDVHLCLTDGTESPARIEYNAPRINLFSRDGVRSDEYFPHFFEYARDNGCDAVIMTGDITDTPTEPNIKALERAVESSPVPVIYVVGNHDWSFFDDYRTNGAKALYLHRFAEVSGGDTELCVRRLDGLNVLTLDNGDNGFTERQLDTTKRLILEGTPLLICFHVPLAAPALSEKTSKVWGRDICIQNSEMAKMIAAADNVAAVLTGHVHFFHEEYIGNTLQIVTGLGAEGMGRLIELGR